MRYRRIFFFLFLFFIFCEFLSQNYNLTNSFSTENSGISSNFIFDIVEDNNSFIWIATQNGVNRFDGKKFFNYTTKDGLPSNDVIQIVKDKNGLIWANCFRQVPAYFDESTNRFVTLKARNIEKICSGLTIFSYNKKGNIIFFAQNANIEIERKQIISSYKSKKISGLEKPLFLNNNSSHTYKETYFTLEKGDFIYSFLKEGDRSLLLKDCFFSISTSRITKYFNFKTKPFGYEKKYLSFDKPLKWLKVNFDNISVITSDNLFQEYSFESFKLLKSIKITSNINFGMFDSKERFFGGTQNEGIKLFTSGRIKNLEIPENFSKENFISINLNDKGELYAGNLAGETLIYNQKKFRKIKIDDHSWIRKNLFFGEKVLTISDNFYTINFKNKNRILKKPNSINALKKAVKVNDSIALISTINGIYKINVKKNKTKILNFPIERISEILLDNNNEYFVVSATGLYKYNLQTNTYRKIFGKYNFYDAAFDGNLLFVLNYQNTIYVFKNEKLIKIISYDKNFPESMVKIKNIDHKIWVASNTGISILDYKENKGKLFYHFENFSKNDGLGSNDINDFSFNNENVYVATGRGISIVPKDISATKYNIKTHIISLKVNEKPLKISDVYNLKSDENYVSIVISGVESSGHFQRFLYRINQGKWNTLQENTLNLTLNGGANNIEIAAVDNNGNVSSEVKKIIFKVDIPFYKNIWLWIFFSGIFFGGIFAIYGRWRFLQQKNYYKQKLALENQRNKITADLHDDIGATLSSLQINSAIANKMIEKEKISEAQKILKKIETQSQKLSENIGDIVWSLKPNKDALMTLSTRIRNSTNEILGSTNIDYKIKIDREIDEKFQDFSERKNIVLIVKESMNNIVKYSKATEVFITFKKIENEYILEVKDNGIGFSQNFDKGNGLQNMKKRTEEIGGHFEIKSKNGTIIKISIPEIRD